MKIKSLRIALSALTISTFGLAACGGPGRSDYAESAPADGCPAARRNVHECQDGQ
jgi:hypothetical protein